MRQRDYILRIIEESGAVLARLRRMLFGGESTGEEFRLELFSSARNLGVDLGMARRASPETLEDLISIGGDLNPTRCWLTAELLFLDAAEREIDGDEEAARLAYDKSLRLFSLLEPDAGFIAGWPEASARIAEVESRLGQLASDQTS